MAAASQAHEDLEALIDSRRFADALSGAEAWLQRGVERDEDRLAVLRVALRSAHFLRERERALRHGMAALGVAQHNGDPRLRARAHNDLAVLYGADGLYARALEHLWSAVHLHEQAGDDVQPAILNNLANVHVHLGRHDEAMVLLSRAIEAYETEGNDRMAATTRSNLGRVHLLADRASSAITHLVAAQEQQERLGDLDNMVATLERLGSAHGKAGAPLRARQAFERSMELIDEGYGVIAEFDARMAYGVWALETGDIDVALAQLQAALDPLPEEGRARVNVLEPLSRALEADGRTEEALAVLRQHVDLAARDDEANARVAAQIRMLDLELGVDGDQAISRMRSTELEQINRRLRLQADRMEHISVTDALTELPNRRAIDHRVEEELARWRRHQRPFVLALLDLDRFKEVNDRYGHDVGDDVLRRVARVLDGSLRTVDIVARWGGEEFALVLPDTDLDEALPVLKRVLEALRSERWSDLVGDMVVTASIGAAMPTEGTDARALLKRADRRLFAAKDAGRNRIVFSASSRQDLNADENTQSGAVGDDGAVEGTPSA